MNTEYPYRLKGSAFAFLTRTRSSSIPSAISRPTWMQVAIWFVLLLLAALISLRDFDAYQFGTHWDDSQYATLARSLVYSDQYGLINVPGQPLPGKYPFAYPLLLVPFLLFAPQNFDALKSMSLVATFLNAGLLFWCWRSFSRTRSYNWALAITGLYVLAPMIVDHTRRVMSEPIFTTFCLLALILAEQRVNGTGGRRWSLQMSVVLMFALFTRTIGFVLIIAVFAYLFIRLGLGFWKEMALIFVQIAVVLGIVVAASPVRATDLLPSEYLKDNNAQILIGEDVVNPGAQSDPSAVLPVSTPAPLTVEQKLKNVTLGWIKYQFGTYPRQVALPIGGGEKEQAFVDQLGLGFLPGLLGYLVAGTLTLGLVRYGLQEGLNASIIFTVLYFGSLSIWVWNDPRLLYPVQPQIQIGWLLGIEAILIAITSIAGPGKWWLSYRQVVLTSIIILLTVGAAYKSLVIEDSRLHAGDLQARTLWLKAHSAPSDVIMTEAPEVDYLYSERKTVRFPLVQFSKDGLENYVKANGVTYILVAPNIDWQRDYVPSYTSTMSANVAVLASLAADHRVQLIYSSDRDLIKVYQALP